MVKALLEGKEPQDAYQYMIALGQQYYIAVPFVNEHRHFARLFIGNIAEVPEAEISSEDMLTNQLKDDKFTAQLQVFYTLLTKALTSL